MRVKPYRRCDICGQTYDKANKCMRIKMLKDPFELCDIYGDPKIMSKLDVCPDCAEKIILAVKMAREMEREEP